MTNDDIVRENLKQEINAVLTKSDDTVISLRNSFPSLEKLVSHHDDANNFSTTAALGEWVEKTDHIQKDEEESLLRARPTESEQ